MSANFNASVDIPGTIVGAAKVAAPMALFVVIEKQLGSALVKSGVNFPPALLGMFGLLGVLLITESISKDYNKIVIDFFSPAVQFLGRWLPLFFVPSLVILPISLTALGIENTVKMMIVLAPGMFCTLLFTAICFTSLRNALPAKPDLRLPPPPSSAGFDRKIQDNLAVLTVVLLGIACAKPDLLGSTIQTAIPGFLAATAFGYVIGSRLPMSIQKLQHPIFTCALFAQIAAVIYGYFTGIGTIGALKAYLTKSLAHRGAGDYLMALLGPVILSFAFHLFDRRELIKRHFPEIMATAVASALFSLYSTAFAGSVLGLQPSLTTALVPRSVTVALALPISSLLQGMDASVTAAAVVITGLLGVNFCQSILDAFGYKDSMVRGVATGGAAHGLGTAALAGKEPEALPFCAVSYALIGIVSTMLVYIPAVQQSLLRIAGF